MAMVPGGMGGAQGRPDRAAAVDGRQHAEEEERRLDTRGQQPGRGRIDPPGCRRGQIARRLGRQAI